MDSELVIYTSLGMAGINFILIAYLVFLLLRVFRETLQTQAQVCEVFDAQLADIQHRDNSRRILETLSDIRAQRLTHGRVQGLAELM